MSIQIKIPSAEKFVYINIGHDWAHHILPMIEETQSKHENGDFSEFTKDLINKLLFAGDNPKITYEENPHADLYEVTADKILVNGKEPEAQRIARYRREYAAYKKFCQS